VLSSPRNTISVYERTITREQKSSYNLLRAGRNLKVSKTKTLLFHIMTRALSSIIIKADILHGVEYQYIMLLQASKNH